ncbi:hypothetical protein BDY19DRAFT_989219 [Irpex rosettiformis]|uniref:Uncharacterized protein n=1 Tax=Irpex rosettiformis TaxID=378272 RepID=A0ACB8UHC1_9APHY|nr:hypothetical protein BDY19DRAFT_989219 [Irpex rosettiformis]
MAYNDKSRPYNGAVSYPPYQDNDNYYSYESNPPPHQTYDPAGFNTSEPGLAAYKDEPGYVAGSKERDTTVGVGAADDFGSATRTVGPKSSKSLKRWRHEHQGDLWMQGGGLRCCGRFFCCTIMLFVFFFIGIVLSLLLWVRPPNVAVGNIQLANASNSINLQNNGIAVTLDVPIVVDNPNYFSVNFNNIHADVFYPINNTKVGSGDLWNLKLDSNKQTNFSVPFTLNYTTSIDPNLSILSDLAGRCGLGGGSQSQIKVDYSIKLDFKVLFIPIKPTIKNSASFSCPFDQQDLENLLKSVGLNIPGLGSLLSALF